MFVAADIRLKFEYDSPEIQNVSRCLRTLYSTRAGSQPLDRNFGIDWDFIDKPLPVAENEFVLEVIKKTEVYETRVQVSDIKFNFDEKSGNMIPVITLKRREE